MKKLVSPGVTLIVGQPARKFAASHDPWPSHAFGYWAVDIFECASGQFVLTFFFRLVNYQTYCYPIGFFASWTLAKEFWDAYLDVIPTGSYVPAFGVWYNWMARPATMTKLPDADFYPWLAAH